jgi:hypothetical protein
MLGGQPECSKNYFINMAHFHDYMNFGTNDQTFFTSSLILDREISTAVFYIR